jgi:serine/threonine protein kinase
VQVVRVDELPGQDADEHHRQLAGLPFPPILEPRTAFDGFRIVRELHGSSRSHIYLAVDGETNATVVIKAPSIDMRDDPAFVEAFLLEEWIARRVDSPHVLKPYAPTRRRSWLYVCFEYVEGQTLAQWMRDHPRPSLEAVRAIVEQVAKGLRAFHRLEMLHQDVRPENIMIDATGTAKIIDFGSTRVAGVVEGRTPVERKAMAGTAQYAAPECFLGEGGSTRSDVFSLGVVTYQMLTGRLPYGAEIAKAKSRAEQSRLAYDPVLEHRRELPAWIDGVLRKAVHTNPLKRYADLAEFTYDLRHPNKEFLARTRPPLIERNPLVFWKGVSLVLLLAVVALVASRPA